MQMRTKAPEPQYPNYKVSDKGDCPGLQGENNTIGKTRI
jgi:hypothetical protein